MIVFCQHFARKHDLISHRACPARISQRPSVPLLIGFTMRYQDRQRVTYNRCNTKNKTDLYTKGFHHPTQVSPTLPTPSRRIPCTMWTRKSRCASSHSLYSISFHLNNTYPCSSSLSSTSQPLYRPFSLPSSRLVPYQFKTVSRPSIPSILTLQHHCFHSHHCNPLTTTLSFFLSISQLTNLQIDTVKISQRDTDQVRVWALENIVWCDFRAKQANTDWCKGERSKIDEQADENYRPVLNFLSISVKNLQFLVKSCQ